VSPEVLRSEPATPATDIWGFGVILYQLVFGKPPFRTATDYLTFQRILKREMEFPEGFDEEAKELVDLILVSP
jgi:3-phosphoinositide dependent protein kinase-1